MTKNNRGMDSPDSHGFAGLAGLVLKDKNKRDNSTQQIFYTEKVKEIEKVKDPISDAQIRSGLILKDKNKRDNSTSQIFLYRKG